MARDNALRKVAPPLPASIDDWVRHIKAERTLNDMVEEIHRLLVNEDEKYRALLRAVWNEHAVEGSIIADDFEAVNILREKAKVLGRGEVAKENKTVLRHSLNVVLKRYEASRKQRRNTLGGEVVPSDNGDDE